MVRNAADPPGSAAGLHGFFAADRAGVAVLVIRKRLGARPAAERRSVMPLKPVPTTPFDERRQSWRWDLDATGVEFQIRGTAAGPDAKWLDLARSCATELDAITAAAMNHLRRTVADVPQETPEVRGVDVGLADRAEIEWFATLQDDYDLWSVSFRVNPPGTFVPIAQSRRQW